MVVPVFAADAATLATTNFITVQSNPPHADVYVDGFYVGKTPATSPDHVTGYYEVRAVLAGYDEYHETVYLKGTANTAVSVTANLVKNTSLCGVVVYTEPTGADVYVDDVYVGTTPKTRDGGLQIAGYPSGTYTFRFEMAGYSTVTKKDYNLIAGSSETIKVTLQKKAVTETETVVPTLVPTTVHPTQTMVIAPPAPTNTSLGFICVVLGVLGAALLLRRE